MNYRLVQFIDSYDPPLKGLQEDLNFVSPRIGEVILTFNLSILCKCVFLHLMTLRKGSYTTCNIVSDIMHSRCPRSYIESSAI